jgi:hypothetical protein
MEQQAAAAPARHSVAAPACPWQERAAPRAGQGRCRLQCLQLVLLSVAQPKRPCAHARGYVCSFRAQLCCACAPDAPLSSSRPPCPQWLAGLDAQRSPPCLGITATSTGAAPTYGFTHSGSLFARAPLAHHAQPSSLPPNPLLCVIPHASPSRPPLLPLTQLAPLRSSQPGIQPCLIPPHTRIHMPTPIPPAATLLVPHYPIADSTVVSGTRTPPALPRAHHLTRMNNNYKLFWSFLHSTGPCAAYTGHLGCCTGHSCCSTGPLRPQ